MFVDGKLLRLRGQEFARTDDHSRLRKNTLQVSTTDDGSMEYQWWATPGPLRPYVSRTPNPAVDTVGDDAPAPTPIPDGDEESVDGEGGVAGFNAAPPHVVGSTTSVLIAELLQCR